MASGFVSVYLFLRIIFLDITGNDDHFWGPLKDSPQEAAVEVLGVNFK